METCSSRGTPKEVINLKSEPSFEREKRVPPPIPFKKEKSQLQKQIHNLFFFHGRLEEKRTKKKGGGDVPKNNNKKKSSKRPEKNKNPKTTPHSL